MLAIIVSASAPTSRGRAAIGLAGALAIAVFSVTRHKPAKTFRVDLGFVR
jgi:hypothetical protein